MSSDASRTYKSAAGGGAGRGEAGLLLETTAWSSECDKSPTVMELAGGQASITAVISNAVFKSKCK